VWERVCSEADICTAAQCQRSKDCFLTKARRDIAKADIIVVNHHMLFSDLAIKKEMGTFTALAVLPAFERLVIDEAHHIEDSATEYFGSEVTQLGAQMLIGRFIRKERGQERGLLPLIKVKLMKEVTSISKRDVDTLLELIDLSIQPALHSIRDSIVITFQAIRSLAAEKCKQVGRDVKWRLTPEAIKSKELADIHMTLVLPVAEDIHQLAQQCSQLLGKLKKIEGNRDEFEKPFDIETAQLSAYRDRLVRLANNLAESTSNKVDPTVVPWIEIDAERPNIVRIIRCPLHVGEALAEWVYPNLKSITMTSATLSVANSFDFLFDRIGLEKLVGKKLIPIALDSPFDFEKQAALYTPQDLPQPDSPKYIQECSDVIGEILNATKGHAFILFTSFYALNITFNNLKDQLIKAGITPLKQGQSSRSELLERFRKDTSSVLFATDSFWEGVDVAGDSLQCVILTKLPFRVPTEPVFQARAEQIDQGGGSAFFDYTVPLAVIKFRQGFGRLIRRKTDRGVIVVLDSRITKKNYGRTFLNSLPPVRHSPSSRAELEEDISAFINS
jgi:ATP-dependent DNA helicase DinG